MTWQEAAHSANTGANQRGVKEFITGAPPAQLEAFCHALDAGPHGGHFPFARMALDIRLAEAAASHSETLQKQVAALCGIAEAQRVLAAKLDKQTDTLIGLTRWLKWLTVGLLILTAALCFFEVLHFQESRNLAIRPAAHVVQPTTNAQQRPPP